MRPVVLLTTDRRPGGPAPPGPRVRPRRAEAWIGESYVEAVRSAGGQPLLVPPGMADIHALLQVADAVVLTGGHFDIHPSHYGAEVSGRLDRVEPTRTELELDLARACLGRGLPVLGVCGGHQALAVAAGGSLFQDIGADLADAGTHEQPNDPTEPWHRVRVTGRAALWIGSQIEANSTHHQAVRDPGRGLVACGHSDDGVIEVIASEAGAFALGVQWHPELLGDLRPYRALIDAVEG